MHGVRRRSLRRTEQVASRGSRSPWCSVPDEACSSSIVTIPGANCPAESRHKPVSSSIEQRPRTMRPVPSTYMWADRRQGCCGKANEAVASTAGHHKNAPVKEVPALQARSERSSYSSAAVAAGQTVIVCTRNLRVACIRAWTDAPRFAKRTKSSSEASCRPRI